MRILVRAKPRAKKTTVELLHQSPLDFGSTQGDMPVYRVAVKEPPTGGQANEAIIRELAKYFETPASSIHLVSGQTSRQKIFEINK